MTRLDQHVTTDKRAYVYSERDSSEGCQTREDGNENKVDREKERKKQSEEGRHRKRGRKREVTGGRRAESPACDSRQGWAERVPPADSAEMTIRYRATIPNNTIWYGHPARFCLASRVDGTPAAGHTRYYIQGSQSSRLIPPSSDQSQPPADSPSSTGTALEPWNLSPGWPAENPSYSVFSVDPLRHHQPTRFPWLL